MALRDSDPAEVGGYRIEDRLGSGGMGVVYLARSASGRRLAVKVVHGQYADDDEFRTRFSREVAAARQVSGAFTAPVVDADADAPRPWMATLYIPGEDLGTHVRRHGPLPLPKVRELAAGLAEALRDIHRAGVVHRDLKPANVMLADDGPRVIDFGISRAAEFAAQDVLTQTGRVMGTPPFMSPEQFSSPHEVGPAADIFSLGSVVAYAATRRGPFDSPSPYETAVKVVEGEPELADVPEDLLPFVCLCLTKHPKSRPTADELLTLLRDGHLPDPRPDSAPTKPDNLLLRPRRRRKRIWPAAAAGAVLLAVTASVAAVQLTGDGPAPSNLPAGWRAWHAKVVKNSSSEGGLFPACRALDGGLICAGDDIQAARYSLASGKVAWIRTVDPTPDPNGNSYEGGILGASAHRVYVMGDEQKSRPNGENATWDYRIQALDTRTGALRWTAHTGDGDGSVAPSVADGTAAFTSSGVLAVTGAKADRYMLLDPVTGAVLWHRALPDPDSCTLHAHAGQGYLVCTAAKAKRTRVSRLDPTTGRVLWTVSASGLLTPAGAVGDRMLFVENADEGTKYRRLTLIDPSRRRAAIVPLARTETAAATVTLSRGTLYYSLRSGELHAVDPLTGRRLWTSHTSVELPGKPLASADRVYLASPGGRLAVLERRTGREVASIPGRGTAADPVTADTGASLTLQGDALYVPYGIRSVYSVDVRHL
ncbi:PQQ-binding-like beta-propeller repeat protein [Streptomyces sp. NPDC047043]|uniref:serine/threonine-protein kinase n=1 Tax=Streptomyces sp. NPDC047043 TaxID=3154497 RepID=UPI0033D40ED8